VATPPPNDPAAATSYLPPDLAAAFGARPLFAWQAAALARPGVLDGGSLIFTAPTSAGKTAIAEILLLRAVMRTRAPALFVLPFNALCAQKADRLARLFAPRGLRVVRAYDRQTAGADPLAGGVGAVVATFERGNALVGRLLEEGRAGALSAVVVDELHMLGDPDRGFLLELMLAKLRMGCGGGGGGGEGVGVGGACTAAAAGTPASTAAAPASAPPTSARSLLRPPRPVQVIGMSATLANAPALAAWLGAALYETDFRPVPLTMHVLTRAGALLDGDGNKGGWVAWGRFGRGGGEKAGGSTAAPPPPAPPIPLAPDDLDLAALAALAAETVFEDAGSVLVFCGTRARAAATARGLAGRLTTASAGGGGGPLPERALTSPGRRPGSAPPLTRADAVAALEGLPSATPGLADCVRLGVAFHSAELTAREREVVEAAFAGGGIAVLAATSTLAAGVNLPVRRVLFRDTFVGRPTSPLDPGQFAQIAGRAGRAGVDPAGQVVVLAAAGTAAEHRRLLALVAAKPKPVYSAFAAGVAGSCGGGGGGDAAAEPAASSAAAPAPRPPPPSINNTCLRRAVFEGIVIRGYATAASVLAFLTSLYAWHGGVDPDVAAGEAARAAMFAGVKATLAWLAGMRPCVVVDGGGGGGGGGMRRTGPRLIEWVQRRPEEARPGDGAAAAAAAAAHDGAAALPASATTPSTACPSPTPPSPTPRTVGCYALTALGRAAAAVGVGPDEALVLWATLVAASARLVLTSSLHPLYVAVPPPRGDFAHGATPPEVAKLIEGRMGGGGGGATAAAVSATSSATTLACAVAAVAAAVGVDHALLARMRTGAVGVASPAADPAYRLYAALALDDLVCERPGGAIAAAFRCSPHALQGLQDAAGGAAYRLAKFAREAGEPFTLVADVLATVERQVSAGVRGELVALTAIEAVRGSRARRLFHAGFKSVRDVAAASEARLREVLQAGGGERGISSRLVRRIKGHAAELHALEAAREALDAKVEESGGDDGSPVPSLKQEQGGSGGAGGGAGPGAVGGSGGAGGGAGPGAVGGSGGAGGGTGPGAVGGHAPAAAQPVASTPAPPVLPLAPVLAIVTDDANQGTQVMTPPGTGPPPQLTAADSPRGAGGGAGTGGGAGAGAGAGAGRGGVAPALAPPPPLPALPPPLAVDGMGPCASEHAATAASAFSLADLAAAAEEAAHAARVAAAFQGGDVYAAIRGRGNRGPPGGCVLPAPGAVPAWCGVWAGQARSSFALDVRGHGDGENGGGGGGGGGLPVPGRQPKVEAAAPPRPARTLHGIAVAWCVASGGGGKAAAAATAAPATAPPPPPFVLYIDLAGRPAALRHVAAVLAGAGGPGGPGAAADPTTTPPHRITLDLKAQLVALTGLGGCEGGAGIAAAIARAVEAGGAAARALAGLGGGGSGGAGGGARSAVPGRPPAHAYAACLPVLDARQAAFLLWPGEAVVSDGGGGGGGGGSPAAAAAAPASALPRPPPAPNSVDALLARCPGGPAAAAAAAAALPAIVNPGRAGGGRRVAAMRAAALTLAVHDRLWPALVAGGEAGAGGGGGGQPKPAPPGGAANPAPSLPTPSLPTPRTTDLVAALARVEAPLPPVVARLETAGVLVDGGRLAVAAAALDRVMEVTAAFLRRAAAGAVAEARAGGDPAAAAAAAAWSGVVDPASAPATSGLLYGLLGLVPDAAAARLRGGGGGRPAAWSTAKAALAAHARRRPPPGPAARGPAAARAVLDWRSAAKVRADCVAALEAAGRVADGGGGGGVPRLRPTTTTAAATWRVRGVWRLAATETGRLTVDEPNLQTMPKPTAYDLAEYVEGDGSGGGGGGGGGRHAAAAPAAAPPGPPSPPSPLTIRVNVRAAIVAPPGCVLLAADYREMELRLAAHLSRDEALIASLTAAGADPLAGLAGAVHSIPATAITPAQRAGAKKVAYGLMYGMGDAALADHLGGVPLAQAAALRSSFLASAPALAAWLAATADAGRDAGCVQTVAGRSRRLHLGTGDGDGGRHHGGHATNTVVQGSAADLARAAMAGLEAALRAGGGGAFPPGAARPILHLHDEVVLEVDAGWVAAVSASVRVAMEGVAAAFGLRVPLPVRMSVGRAWGEMMEEGV